MHALRIATGLALGGLAILPFHSAYADPPHQHRSPPKAAFDACSDASQGDACSVSLHGHDLEGTCETFGDEGLACRPEGPPPHPHD